MRSNMSPFNFIQDFLSYKANLEALRLENGNLPAVSLTKLQDVTLTLMPSRHSGRRKGMEHPPPYSKSWGYHLKNGSLRVCEWVWFADSECQSRRLASSWLKHWWYIKVARMRVDYLGLFTAGAPFRWRKADAHFSCVVIGVTLETPNSNWPPEDQRLVLGSHVCPQEPRSTWGGGRIN